MSRTKLLQDLRLMKFEDILSKRTAGKLTQERCRDIGYFSAHIAPLGGPF